MHVMFAGFDQCPLASDKKSDIVYGSVASPSGQPNDPYSRTIRPHNFRGLRYDAVTSVSYAMDVRMVCTALHR